MDLPLPVLAMPSSILGNEAALRFGRHRAIAAVMLASGAIAVAIGLCASMSPWLLVTLVLIYGVTVPADSGALTSGMAASAVSANRGATMALHSTVGFGLSAVGAWAAGAALDAGGGPRKRVGMARDLCGAGSRHPHRPRCSMVVTPGVTFAQMRPSPLRSGAMGSTACAPADAIAGRER